ncbi:tRNA 2-thiouridine(34) synthase MnmA [Opitutus sp. GAS368]|jgi:tRNA-specific 2-thiouridylase|uniref:tRNA 2-thiouridine(34) synthase MnmA n=1 Tax=Opitutus sp. GAS368 TaxID=1882749 RepID=UPI00087CCC7F|nr:tRNA 2-thiouridine(34) synthase MnmA [Opitutus sp. GAS368]SDR66904.1 tRNA-specific 2-thiouridylase [Opitutus sp. GAS368]
MSKERILVAMSGGVDSSVAALLLKQQGHDIVGAYMKNWINEDNVIGHCPWMQDIDDARAVTDRIGIEFRVVNLMADYRRLVVDYLLDGYQRGLTPNPDVMCNREMKFGVFAKYAQAEGFAAVATGHYARRVEASTVGSALAPTLAAASSRPTTFALLEGLDKNKDQSYFLALLSQAQLAAARFPIGHLTKPELRALAADAKLPTAGKKDSQGICFIGEVKMADFLKTYVPDHPGPIVRATDGKVIGEHRGLHYYTIGQRRGIRIPSNTDDKAYVVTGKRPDDHALLVAFDGPDAPGLWANECRVHGVSFIGEPVRETRRIECKVRYRDPRVFIEFTPAGRANPPDEPSTDRGSSGRLALPQTASVKFEQPQRALAPGQIMALYDGEKLLGGGVFA